VCHQAHSAALTHVPGKAAKTAACCKTITLVISCTTYLAYHHTHSPLHTDCHQLSSLTLCLHAAHGLQHTSAAPHVPLTAGQAHSACRASTQSRLQGERGAHRAMQLSAWQRYRAAAADARSASKYY
jgi:hypothetical protein